MAGIAVGEVLKGKYPAKEHARQVADWIANNGGAKDGLLYLEAQKLKYNEVMLMYTHSDLNNPMLMFTRTMIKKRASDSVAFSTIFRDANIQIAT